MKRYAFNRVLIGSLMAVFGLLGMFTAPNRLASGLDIRPMKVVSVLLIPVIVIWCCYCLRIIINEPPDLDLQDH